LEAACLEKNMPRAGLLFVFLFAASAATCRISSFQGKEVAQRFGEMLDGALVRSSAG
jgi:hypothetical protein